MSEITNFGSPWSSDHVWRLFLGFNLICVFLIKGLARALRGPALTAARALRGPALTAARALRGRPTANLTIKVP